MTITKEEFDSLQVGDELVNEYQTLKIDFKMPNTIIVYDLDTKHSGVYSLGELQDEEFQLKPKTKHLHGFPVGDYSDKNVLVACSDESVLDAKENGIIMKLIEVTESLFNTAGHISCAFSVTYKYAILLSDNVELVKE